MNTISLSYRLFFLHYGQTCWFKQFPPQSYTVIFQNVIKNIDLSFFKKKCFSIYFSGGFYGFDNFWPFFHGQHCFVTVLFINIFKHLAHQNLHSFSDEYLPFCFCRFSNAILSCVRSLSDEKVTFGIQLVTAKLGYIWNICKMSQNNFCNLFSICGRQ